MLVLRALDGAEHLLALHDAQHLSAGVDEQIAIGLGERGVAVGGEDAAQVRALEDRHRDERDASARARVVRDLAGLGRADDQRLAIAQDRAEHTRRGQPRHLGDVVGFGHDLLELHALAVVLDPDQRDGARAERALERREHPARRVADHADAADREQPLLFVARPRRAAARPERGGDQPVVARRLAQRGELVVEPLRAAVAITRASARAADRVRGGRARRIQRVQSDRDAQCLVMPVRTNSAASRNSAAPSVAIAPGRAITVAANATIA